MNAEREFWKRTRSEFVEFVMIVATLAATALAVLFWAVILEGAR